MRLSLNRRRFGLINVSKFVAGTCCLGGLLSAANAAELTPPSSTAHDHAVVQALLRIPDSNLKNFESQTVSVQRYLSGIATSESEKFVSIANRLQVPGVEDRLIEIASMTNGGNAAVEAARLLIDRGQAGQLRSLLQSADTETRQALVQNIAAVESASAALLVLPVVLDESQSQQMRSAAARSLGRTWHGQQEFLKLARANKVPEALRFDISNSLLGSWTKEIAEEAKSLESIAPIASSQSETLPSTKDLSQMKGVVKNGKQVYFSVGTCSKCHQVGGEGVNVGPDLSEIGSKLSREDMFVSILNPSAAISHNYETYSLLTVDGVVISGLLIGKTDTEVSIKTSDGSVKVVAADDVDGLTKQEVSLMPADLQKSMSTQNLVDLVEYLTVLKKPEQQIFDADASGVQKEPSRDPNDAIGGFEIADGLKVQLFAYEPKMFSPTAIDVDHRGRVWVCEAVNYRHFRNTENQPRSEGDRILIMTDTDGDGAADETTVFYQGSDIDSPHGVCVLGDRVLVSAGENVFSFRDTDGDDKADEKTVLFTGISGVQHDHGIHSFMPGPDGKLYFNFGNEGKQILDANRQPIVDLAGNEVNDTRKPYQQGMVFRCDLDGSNLETLGWNFRNNWEVAVDSFGALWQSDNDDDGNRGTRINYVMEYGNYGYRDELTGDFWYSRRIGDDGDTSLRHWHLNDPGVVPNLLQTGAGSPTGMMVYEGDLLPEKFRGQMIHTDPGPSVARAYPVQKSGAGYTAEIANMIRGVTDQWFRPVDAVAAPDGSVIVADWYDPGVGGHRMGDIERGRLFRMTVAGHEGYKVAAPDFGTVEGALQALESANVETRFLAGQALRKMGLQTQPDVNAWLDASKTSSTIRARRLWVLAKIDSVSVAAIERGLTDADEDVRIAAIRAARQTKAIDKHRLITDLSNDPSAAIRRELLIALRELEHEDVPKLWTMLASHYDGKDRWYLEALGIAANDRWEQIFPVWLASVGDQWDSPRNADIVWRSRTPLACKYLAQLIESAADVKQQERYFRALDFIAGPEKATAIESLVAK
jgi:putative membrane-bound dehydrogenase-like protein